MADVLFGDIFKYARTWEFVMILGYTCGVYDLFHIGHLNLLKNAKGLCDKLIVGVSVDKLVQYKFKTAVIPFEERIEIIRNIKFVDSAIPQEDIDKYKMWEKLHFDVLFVGDDWFETPSWKEMQTKFQKVGVRVVYFPYTKGTSSTILSQTLQNLRKNIVNKNNSTDSCDVIGGGGFKYLKPLFCVLGGKNVA